MNGGDGRTYDLARGVVIGTVAHDPKVEYTASGVGVFTITVVVAVPRRGGEGVEESDFLVVLYGERAEAIASSGTIAKGSRVMVTGRWRKNKWERDGQKRSRTEFIASAVSILQEPKLSGKESPRGRAAQSSDDDIPF